MNLELKCAQIDRTTGNIDRCLKLIKAKAPNQHLFKLYKQYWVLVYECGFDLDSLNQCLEIPE